MTDEQESKHDAQTEIPGSDISEKKKAGKFQPFRKLFGKKKKKDSLSVLEGTTVKQSHSIGDLCDSILSSDEETNDKLRAPNCTMGTRAFSHDSIFMPDEQEDDEKVAQTMSQDNILGKVKILQQQLAKNIKFGQPPKSISARKVQDTEADLEEEEFPCSPMEILNQLDQTLHDNGNKPSESSNSLIASEMGKEVEEKVIPIRSSHAKRSLASSGTIESINLDDIPRAGARLDNSAAKHKLLVKPRHQRLSKKHKRSAKDLQNVTDIESEQNTTETLLYKETGQVKNGHILADEQNQDMERQKQIDLEEEKKRKEEHQRLCEAEEKRQKAEAEEKNRLENQRHQELEEQRQEQERRRLEEEKRQQLIEEENHLKMEQQRRQELEEQKQLELEEEKRLQFEEKQRQEEEKRKKEQMQHEMEERKQKEEQRQRELEEQKRLEMEEQQRQEEEKRKKEAERQQLEKEKQKKIEEQKLLELHQQQQQQAEEFRQQQEKEKMGEEMRWQELDQRQTMPKSYTFKVSSGEKQIIFEKVNLSPVTPVKELLLSSDVNEPTKSSMISHALPSALCVPHTAILVTGAQLCGPAVNLNQIKDTACKSLLGLTEEKKTIDIPPLENRPKETHESKPDPNKLKFTTETLENQSTMAELVSIRSRILKNTENGKFLEQDQKGPSRFSDDWTTKGKGDSHSNLRKTLSASAKFSITPAWQKFSEAMKSSDNKDYTDIAKQTVKYNNDEKTAQSVGHSEDMTVHRALGGTEGTALVSTSTAASQVNIMDSTEGCKFAKDLPSFLVPGLPQPSCKASLQSDSPTKSEMPLITAERKLDKTVQRVEEKMSPFGIKLRRTNYSLRFHSDQQSEQKKKKRYSAGDSFDGVPSSWVTTDCEKEASYVSRNQLASTGKEPPISLLKISSSNVCGSSHSTIAPLSPLTNSHLSSFSNEKTASKPQLPSKPMVAPKPPSHTPPSSPLMRLNRSNMADAVAHKVASTDSETKMKLEDNVVSTVSPLLQNDKSEEEETKEKKSFFPSINIPWKEKADKKPELIRKEKPVLQSRHSLDGSRLMENVEAAQPLWITLALQKQKGFREQQATREERRQAREAKQAEKLAKEIINAGVNSQSDSRCSSVTCPASTPQKLVAPKEDKKIESVVSWLERREQLRKSNTLPTSVTVEISDPISSAPLVKEINKRFSTPDATPVSTEPAWLALAKRKAKAWSDCPQIIKQIH